MGFLKEITTPTFTFVDIIVMVFAWGATNGHPAKTIVVGSVWFIIESLIRKVIQDNEIKLSLKQKLNAIRQEDSKIVE